MRNFTITLLFLSLLPTGCGVGKKVSDYISGGEDNSEPPSPLVDFVTRSKIIEIWEQDVGGGSDNQYLKLTPAITPEKIYVANNEGDIKALNTTNGKQIWSVDADAPVSGGPGTGVSHIYVGTSEGEVLAFNNESGEFAWRVGVTSEVLATPRESEDIVIIRTTDGKIHALNATDGSSLWIYDRSVPVLTLRGTSSPVIIGDLVISGFDGGKLAAIELQTGKLIWETSIAVGRGRTELERMVDIDSDPLVIDGVIYVGSFQGRIAALDLDSGKILWTRDIASYAGLSADDKHIFVTDDDSHIWALDRTNGSSVWKQEKLYARAATTPATIGDLVVTGDLEGYLHWMDKFSGEFVARTQLTDARMIAPPTAIDEVVYVYASDGTLGAYTYDSFREKAVSTHTEQLAEEPEISLPETEQPIQETEITSTNVPSEASPVKKEKSTLGKFLEIFTGGDDCDEEESDQCD